MLSKRHFFGLLGSAALLPASGLVGQKTTGLPLAKTFIGEGKFAEVVKKAVANNWGKVPMGQRMGLLAMEFHGVPYVGFTLEIDDRVEAPSANLKGLDCWTFFEVVLGLARMLETPRASYAPQHLLDEILWTRYRGGRCSGSYLERIHYLNEWWFDNTARGNVKDLTTEWGVDEALVGRESREMTKLWKSYRYLKHNPDLRPPMARLEALVTALPVRYIPNAEVPGIEAKLQTGDILGIVTKHQGGVCSHVGLCVRLAGERHPQIMHASSNHRKVVLEGRVSEYLKTYTAHKGLLVCRPLPAAERLNDPAEYRAKLKGLTGGVIVE